MNHFQLWKLPPFEADEWPGAEITTKLSFPLKVQMRGKFSFSLSVPFLKVEMRGSWGEELVECRWDDDEGGNLCADLPPLSPGVYHYNFLINGSQVKHTLTFWFSLCGMFFLSFVT